MTNRVLRAGGLLASMVVLGAVSACTGSSPFSSSRRFSTPPAQLEPVASSNVQSTSLPPLSGAATNQSEFPIDGVVSQDPLLADNQFPLQTPDGSFVAIDPTGVPTNVQARDLSGSLTTQTMLGAWTVISGADQCRVNLTQTTKQGTNRFRASAPGCTIPVLSDIASWKLAGTQVQFYSGAGQLIATLLKTGNRFIGTLAGGQGISMAG